MQNLIGTADFTDAAEMDEEVFDLLSFFDDPADYDYKYPVIYVEDSNGNALGCTKTR